MIYWIQEATQAGAQQAAPSLLSPTQIGAIAGSVVGLVGVLIAQYLTERRHSQSLRHTAELEAQRADQSALQKYFEHVGKLLMEPSKSDSLTTIIRAQTLGMLEGLEPDRKRILLQFLYESGLIGPRQPSPILQGANLRRANLERINLRWAFLREANLESANLESANLESAYLESANLESANLQKAYLVEANLERADLSGAVLTMSNLHEANLKEADLSGAVLLETTEESLTQTQINGAVGNDATKLPDHLQRPAHWSKGKSGKS